VGGVNVAEPETVGDKYNWSPVANAVKFNPRAIPFIIIAPKLFTDMSCKTIPTKHEQSLPEVAIALFTLGT
jgi:hypothetical protein